MKSKEKTALLVQGLERICADIAAIASLLEDDGGARAGAGKEKNSPAKEKAMPEAPTPETPEAPEKATGNPPLPPKAAQQEQVETAEEPTAAQQEETEPAEEPMAAPGKVYTYEEVRAILAEKARTGFRAEVKANASNHPGPEQGSPACPYTDTDSS